MRVVHVASGREWRGGQRQVWLLARELQAIGVDQVVVTGGESELAERLRLSGIRVRSTRWRAGLDPRVLQPIFQELRRPALLHAHDSHALTLAGFCGCLTQSPVVVTRRVTFPLRRRFFWRRACRIIAISSAVRQALIDDGMDESRLVLIPSAVDPLVAAGPAVGLRTRLGLSESGQLAVNLGALTPEKGQSTLITAAQQLVRDLPDLHWLIVGEGAMEKTLQQQIAKLGLSDRVHLLTQLKDPHRVLAEADIFVLSSTSEGLGSSVLAAMAQGVPVVATRVGGVPELLQSGGGLLVEPEDSGALAGAVRRVLGDPELRENLTRKAREELGKFSADAMAVQVLSVYRSCAHTLGGS